MSEVAIELERSPEALQKGIQEIPGVLMETEQTWNRDQIREILEPLIDDARWTLDAQRLVMVDDVCKAFGLKSVIDLRRRG